jgi:hypothetical protein
MMNIGFLGMHIMVWSRQSIETRNQLKEICRNRNEKAK